MYTYPFETLQSAAMQTGIFEWMSPNFHSPMFYPLAALIFLTVAGVALSKRRPRPSEILLFVVFGLAALRSMRNLTLFVLVAFPLLGEYAEIPGWKLPELRAGVRRVLQAAVLLLAAVIAAEVASNGFAADLQMERARFPEKAATFLAGYKLPTPLLNSYDFGGYLIWKLYPGYRVYIDGRADLYGDEFLEKFIQLYDVQVDPRPRLNEAGIRTVMVEPGSALASYLRTQSEWQRVYEDRVAVIFTR
jgi:signal transduction histidine kinase